MQFQNDPELENIVHMACRFDAIAYSREVLLGKPWTLGELVDAWVGAKNRKIINDKNVIVDDGALFEYLKVPLRTIPVGVLGMPTVTDGDGVLRVAPATSPIDGTKYWVLERWFWQQSHFVKGCGFPGVSAEYDPIVGGSLTRKNGTCMDLRVFPIVR
jgi:hypothetical protein